MGECGRGRGEGSRKVDGAELQVLWVLTCGFGAHLRWGGRRVSEVSPLGSDRSRRPESARGRWDRTRGIGRGRRGRIPGRPGLLPHRRAPWAPGRVRSGAVPFQKLWPGEGVHSWPNGVLPSAHSSHVNRNPLQSGIGRAGPWKILPTGLIKRAVPQWDRPGNL